MEPKNTTKAVWGHYPISRLALRAMASPVRLSWTFERGKDRLQVETHSDPVAREYVIVTARAGNPPVAERYNRYAEYLACVLALDHSLAEQRWHQVGSPPLFSCVEASTKRHAPLTPEFAIQL
jgi:hypothetical protein